MDSELIPMRRAAKVSWLVGSLWWYSLAMAQSTPETTETSPKISELLESATQVKFARKCRTDPELFKSATDRLPPRPDGRLASPDYPVAAARERREGVVKMLMQINEEGRVTHAVVERSSGYTDLDLAGLVTTEKWRYKPALVAGKPHCAWGSFELEFRLAKKQPAKEKAT